MIAERSAASARFFTLRVLVAATGQVFSRITSAWKARQAAKNLTELDDYLLHDMGLTRDDLSQAFMRHPVGDPTRFLSGRAARNIDSANRRRRGP